MNRDDVVRAALATAEAMASDRLRREDARLYSQHSRLQNRQAGLRSWGANESDLRLRDAIQLLHAGTILKEDGNDRWRQCFQRCGELLEWLSHPNMQLSKVPVQLLSAAAYVVAGFPARADALLRDADDGRYSAILRSFIRGNLATTLDEVRTYWQEHSNRQRSTPTQSSDDYVASRLVEEVIRALGVICSSARWADESRTAAAVEKLDALARIYASDRDPYSWLLARLRPCTTIKQPRWY